MSPPGVRFSSTANNSYITITIAIAPIVTNPAKASGMRIDDPADTSR
jgi:hypothetical protein